MICHQCGAEYDSGLLQCPYCNSENTKEAGRQKNRALERYDREAADIRKEAERYPDKTANRWTGLMIRGIAIALAVSTAITIIYLFLSRLFVKIDYNNKEDIAARLEEYYQAEDYDAMTEYMSEEYLYESIYEKYTEVRNVYGKISDMEQYMAYMQEINTCASFSAEEKKQSFLLWSEDYFTAVREALYHAEVYTNDRVFRGNEEVLTALKEEVLTELYELGFSREEVDRIRKDEPQNIEDLEEKLFDILISG